MSRRSMIRLLLVAALLVSGCGNPVDEAPSAIRNQYLQVARIAGQNAGLAVSDEDWLDLARTICDRRVRTPEDYDALVIEMEEGAPNPALGRAVKDAGRTAIQLFCPVG